MYDFNYHKPASVSDAVSAANAAEDAKYLAGGQTLLPTMKQRLAMPSDLLDLSGSGIAGITVDGDNVVIGAMTSHDAVASSADVKAAIPGLAALAAGIGDQQVRNRGTIGGSVANNDPAADYPAACVALGATIKTDRREIGADDFFKGMFETALEEDEVITSISFPKPAACNYQKFPNPASRYALVGVMVAKTGAGVRVAVTGAGEAGVFRASDTEAALATDFSGAAAANVTVSAEGLNNDIHASAAYRANLIGVMAKRAVEAC